ncbi:MAG: substrate-binding domain-containing protein [Spirochaetaceae bacterium]|jgi:ribose transport system substrate-binding protein|nr:substrate-binding domain-containing protein [Spirochaetaceae bacterium]
MRKVCAVLPVIFMIALAAGCSQKSGDGGKEKKEKGWVVGLSAANTGNTWCAQFVDDFSKRAQEYVDEGVLAGYTVSSTDGDITEQVTQCITMINNDVDALLIWPVSPTALQSVVDAADDKGTLLILANEPAAYEGHYALIGDNAQFQRIQAKWLVEQLGGEGNIVQITGTPGFAADTLRKEAAEEVFKNYPGIKTLASAPGNWNTTDAQQAMTTFLSTYNNIDAVFSQDVMGEGILKAFENAGIEPAIATGDYTKSFFKKWAELPALNSIGVTYQAGVIVSVLDMTVGLLQGREFKDGVLQPNPMDPSLINTIFINPAYVVTREGDPNAPWMEGLVGVKAITLDEALRILEDASDATGLDGWMSREEALQVFK